MPTKKNRAEALEAARAMIATHEGFRAARFTQAGVPGEPATVTAYGIGARMVMVMEIPAAPATPGPSWDVYVPLCEGADADATITALEHYAKGIDKSARAVLELRIAQVDELLKLGRSADVTWAEPEATKTLLEAARAYLAIRP